MNYDYPDAQKMEHFDYGIRRYWLDNGQVAVIASEGDMSRVALDLWTEVVLGTARDWPPGQELYAILDLTGDRQGFTPYSRKSAQDIYRYVSQQAMHVTVAIIMRDTIFNKLLNLFLLGLLRGVSNMTQRFFLHHDEGLAWLREQVAREQTKKIPGAH